MKTLRIGCMAIILLLPAFKSRAVNLPSQVGGHRSGLTARVVSLDGSSRTVRLDGIGCTESMCSRVFVRNESESRAPLQTWLDTIVSIKEITENNALFAMKDGTERRLAFVSDFRVIYISDATGSGQKLDLGKIRSLEFTDSGK